MPLHREAQSARGGEIERARIARDLSDDKGQIAATQPLFKREQGVFGFVCSNVDQAVLQFLR